MVFKILSRVINRCKRIYRKQLFKSEIGCNHNDFNIVGDITVINKNIKLGRNVTIYPGVMFWGDGLIEIGDNVDIGKDTVIYSSKSGGGGMHWTLVGVGRVGMHWKSYLNCRSVLYN